jgi:hypothetical protein
MEIYFIAHFEDGKPDKEVHSGRDLNKLFASVLQ